jgi:hypothetical protein
LAKATAIAILYLPHPTDDKKVEAVKTEMRKLGAPKIRVVDCNEYYMAIEGCHRLMAAADLGIAPRLTLLNREDPVEVDSVDTDYFQAGTTCTAGAFADAFRDPMHNPSMIINLDGTLTVVDLTAEEDE